MISSDRTPPPGDLTSTGDLVTRWWAIVSADHGDPARHALVNHAAELADASLAGAAATGWLRPRKGTPEPDLDPNVVRQVWARVALLWHQVLTDTDVFAKARAGATAACRFDPAAARAWLAHDAGLVGEDFGLSGFHKLARITHLVAAAQAAGMLTVPGSRIEILHVANERGFVDRHRVALTTPMHGSLCSPDIDTIELLTDDLYGVDAAVHLFTVVAEETNHLLAQRALLADLPTGKQPRALPASRPEAFTAVPDPPATTVDRPLLRPAIPPPTASARFRRGR